MKFQLIIHHQEKWWKEFRSPDFEEIKTQLKTPVIFDGRNQYNGFNLEKRGIEYYQIGKK